jgi:hypothetical protein
MEENEGKAPESEKTWDGIKLGLCRHSYTNRQRETPIFENSKNGGGFCYFQRLASISAD